VAYLAKQQYPEPTVGGLIISPDYKIFLMKTHKFRGKYVVPGGHIELGESMQDALIREVKEETNLDVFDIQFLCFQEFIYNESFWKKRHYIFFDFVCRSNSMDAILNEEAQEYIWVTPQEALEMPIDPYTRVAIRKYLERIGVEGNKELLPVNLL
jgi:nucleoside triphosphatase